MLWHENNELIGEIRTDYYYLAYLVKNCYKLIKRLINEKKFYKFIKYPAYLLNGFELIIHLIIVFFLITFISILFALFFSSLRKQSL